MNAKIEQMQAVIEALPDPVFVLTESGRYADIAGGTDSRFYHDGSVLVGKHLYEVLPKEKADWFLEQIHHALKTMQLHTIEYGLGGIDVDGLDEESGPSGTLWFEARIQPLTSLYDGERAVVWVARNITERFQLENQLRILSEHDELTGVYNRRKLMEELSHRFDEFKRYHTSTVAMVMDIDHFKSINDEHGHQSGDAILVKVSKTCQGLLRNLDMIARIGGEEFAFLLPQTRLQDALKFANRVSDAINLITTESNHPITVSIGISEFIASDQHAESVIHRADEAMYEAKHAGRNRIVIAKS